jgi:hypothetical protein
MELIPFNPSWSESGSKLDLKALYRRASQDGQISIVSLPVRRHNDWSKKGFTYVTLTSAEDVIAIKPSTAGMDWTKVQQSYDINGHFKMSAYLAEQGERDAARLADLQAQVDKHGFDSVLSVMRSNDPSFVMPDGIVAKKKATTGKDA